MLISVLLPTYGRPAMLDRAILSLRRSACEILVGVDPSDTLATEADAISRQHGCIVVIREIGSTLGAAYNCIAAKASGDLLMSFVDDYVIEQPDWGVRLLASAASLPDNVGFLSPRDPIEPGFTTLPILSRKVYETLGYFMAPYFPYWFMDTWWDELRTMTGLWADADFDVSAPEGRGKTRGLTDLDFWARVFEASRTQRIEDAIKMMRLGYFPGVAKACAARVEHLRSPAFLAQWSGNSDGPPTAGYDAIKARAAERFGVEP